VGGVELLLSLNAKCRFVGHAGLITVDLRRMLDDKSHFANSNGKVGFVSQLRSFTKKQARGVEK